MDKITEILNNIIAKLARTESKIVIMRGTCGPTECLRFSLIITKIINKK